MIIGLLFLLKLSKVLGLDFQFNQLNHALATF